MQSALDAATENKIFKWSDENIMAQLPLQPGVTACFVLYLYAATDFIAPASRNGNGNENFDQYPFHKNYVFIDNYI